MMEQYSEVNRHSSGMPCSEAHPLVFTIFSEMPSSHYDKVFKDGSDTHSSGMLTMTPKDFSVTNKALYDRLTMTLPYIEAYNVTITEM